MMTTLFLCALLAGAASADEVRENYRLTAVDLDVQPLSPDFLTDPYSVLYVFNLVASEGCEGDCDDVRRSADGFAGAVANVTAGRDRARPGSGAALAADALREAAGDRPVRLAIVVQLIGSDGLFLPPTATTALRRERLSRAAAAIRRSHFFTAADGVPLVLAAQPSPIPATPYIYLTTRNGAVLRSTSARRLAEMVRLIHTEADVRAAAQQRR